MALPNDLPLPKELWDGPRDDANRGLWFDKFIDTWHHQRRGDWVIPVATTNDRGGKVRFLKKFFNRNAAAQATSNRLAAYLERRNRLVVQQLGGRSESFITVSPWISGLSSGHPLETGLVWHPTLGVPYLSGSGIKGLLHAWAAIEEQPRITEIFGTEAAQGQIIVFDAIPCCCPNLTLDIMTPHYAPYYENPADNPPADWYSPIPIPFLVVAPRQWFNFALAPLAKEDSGISDGILEEAMQLLRDALAILGAGGKTAVGYGLFEGGGDRQSKEGLSS